MSEYTYIMLKRNMQFFDREGEVVGRGRGKDRESTVVDLKKVDEGYNSFPFPL